MTNWSNLLVVKRNYKNTFSNFMNFANGKISGEVLYDKYKGTERGGEVRSLLRNHGVSHARKLAKRALARRGVRV